MRRGKGNTKKNNNNNKRNNRRNPHKSERYPLVEEEMEEDAKLGPPNFKPLTADQLIKYWNSNKLLKTVISKTPISDKIETIDGSIKNRNAEDESFLRDQELQERMRRGNTLIRVLGNTGAVSGHVIGRRGLPKFYDLRAAHIDIMNGRGQFKDFKNSENKLLYHEWRTFIPRAQKALKDGLELTVYLSEKANGENAQVSYVSAKQMKNAGIEIKDGFFIVCSKNVGIIFRDSKDIDWYSGQRFSYAQQISRTWLNQFYELDAEKQDQLKEFLSEHTFIGEYCGNQKLQHMVHYDKEEVIFYAVVKKLGAEPCLPFDKGSEIIKGYGLPCVSMDPYPEITSFEDLGAVIEKLSKEVAKAPVEKMGEGSVVYIESRNEKSGERRVVGICKLKTLDYRFWRKLREKLKNYLNDRYDKPHLLKKFKGECKDLIGQGNFETCHKIDYYLEVADKAVDIIRMCHITGEHLRTVYLDFLDLARKCLEEKRLPTDKEKDYFKYLSLEMEAGSEIVLPEKNPRFRNKKESKRKHSEKKVSFAVNKEDEETFGMEEKSEILEKPEIGANVIFTFPPGFVELDKLVKYAEELDFKVAYGYQENTEEENYLRICLPSQLNDILGAALKTNDYILGLEMDDEVLGLVGESKTKKLLDVKDSDNEFLKSFFNQFEGNITQEGLTDKINYEAEILTHALKGRSNAYHVRKYLKIKQINDEEFEYDFNYGKMDQTLVHLLKDHRVKHAQEGKHSSTIMTMKHGEIMKVTRHVDADEEEENVEEVNEVFYIVFYGLSCIGKSYFFEYFQKKCVDNSINSVIVSSDECAERAVKIYQEQNPEAGYDEAFEKTRKLTNKLFDEEIKTFTDNLNPGKNIVLLDKVMHGKRFLSSIEKFFPTPNHRVRIFAFHPLDYEHFNITDKVSIPFSASLILNLCHRTISRGEHLTVTGDDKKKIFLTLSFSLLYKNIRDLQKAKAGECNFAAFYPVSFHKFTEEKELPEEYVQLLRTVMRKIKAFNEGEALCQDIVDLLKNEEAFSKLEGNLGYGDLGQWDQVISKIFDNFSD